MVKWPGLAVSVGASAFLIGLDSVSAQAVVVGRPVRSAGIGVHAGAYVGVSGFGGGHHHHQQRVLLTPGAVVPAGVPTVVSQGAGASVNSASVLSVLELLRLLDQIGSRVPSANGGPRIDALNSRLQSIEGKLDRILTEVGNSASQAELTATRVLVEQHDAVLQKLWDERTAGAKLTKQQVALIKKLAASQGALGDKVKTLSERKPAVDEAALSAKVASQGDDIARLTAELAAASRLLEQHDAALLDIRNRDAASAGGLKKPDPAAGARKEGAGQAGKTAVTPPPAPKASK